MAELSAEIAPQVVAASNENAEEVAGALGRAFDGEFVVKPGELGAHVPETAPTGAGLVILFQFGEQGAAALIPAEGGLLPDWCKEPDPTGESKLSTLGQELSMLFFPDDLMADQFEARWVEDLGAALSDAGPNDDAACLPIELVQGETLVTLSLVWPLTSAGAPAKPASEASPEPETVATPEAEPATAPLAADFLPQDLSDLPANTLSLLQVVVPVSVNLGSKKQPIEEIIALGPGSIITFDKSCNDLLELSVGNRRIAEGEAVKVGERFGIRIRKMILPDEHFRAARSSRTA